MQTLLKELQNHQTITITRESLPDFITFIEHQKSLIDQQNCKIEQQGNELTSLKEMVLTLQRELVIQKYVITIT